MMFMVLMHPTTSEAYLLGNGDGFLTIDEAVKAAIDYGTSDFWVITKHEWEAVQPKGESDE